MADADPTQEHLQAELARLRQRVAELEAALAARPAEPAAVAALGSAWTAADGHVGGASLADEPDVMGYLAPFAPGAPPAENALRATAERYALIATGTGAGIWDIDFVTSRGYLSPRWKEIVGYDGSDPLAAHREFEERLHPDDRPRYIAAQRDHLQRRVPLNLEVRLRDQAGGIRWVQVIAQAQWGPDGRAVRLVGSLCDITARKRLEEAHRERQRAEGQLEGVTYTARELAHRLNNDLAVVAGVLELVESGVNVPPPLRTLLADANQGLNSAVGHVARLQRVTRVETRQTPVGPALDLDRSSRGDPPAAR